MVVTRKSIPSRAGDAADDDPAKHHDPKAQAALKVLQIDAGEHLGGAQLLGKRKSASEVRTYIYNGASYEVDQNTMEEWIEADRQRLAKKRRLHSHGSLPSSSAAPRGEAGDEKAAGSSASTAPRVEAGSRRDHIEKKRKLHETDLSSSQASRTEDKQKRQGDHKNRPPGAGPPSSSPPTRAGIKREMGNREEKRKLDGVERSSSPAAQLADVSDKPLESRKAHTRIEEAFDDNVESERRAKRRRTEENIGGHHNQPRRQPESIGKVLHNPGKVSTENGRPTSSRRATGSGIGRQHNHSCAARSSQEGYRRSRAQHHGAEATGKVSKSGMPPHPGITGDDTDLQYDKPRANLESSGDHEAKMRRKDVGQASGEEADEEFGDGKTAAESSGGECVSDPHDRASPPVAGVSPGRQDHTQADLDATATDHLGSTAVATAVSRRRDQRPQTPHRESSSRDLARDQLRSCENAADAVKRARKSGRHVTWNTGAGDEDDTRGSEEPADSVEQTVAADDVAKAQRSNAIALFRHLQKMSKTNSQVLAIIARARKLKAKYRDRISAKRRSLRPTVMSPPTSREHSFTSPDVNLEVPDSDPAAKAVTSAVIKAQPISVLCSPTPEPHDDTTLHPPQNQGCDPLHWRLDLDKLQDGNQAASEIYRLKKEGESKQARHRRVLKEEALVMSWEVLDDGV
nr:hypothetical protein CFP56_04648 [Quercus suber]